VPHRKSPITTPGIFLPSPYTNKKAPALGKREKCIKQGLRPAASFFAHSQILLTISSFAEPVPDRYPLRLSSSVLKGSFVLMSKTTTLSCHFTTKTGFTFHRFFFAKRVPERDGPLEENHNFMDYMGL